MIPYENISGNSGIVAYDTKEESLQCNSDPEDALYTPTPTRVRELMLLRR